MPSAGGSGSFIVNAAGTCGWNAATTFPWIHITSAANGAGPGTVQFTVDANTGSARSGTITLNAQTFTVNQDGGCNPSVTPDTFAAPAAGGPQTVTITTSQECSWTAVSNDPSFIVIGGPSSGSGNGAVRLDIQQNTGPPRSGTATIAGRTVTVNQDSGCSVTLTPPSQDMPAAGGSSAFAVTAGGGCTWTAESNVPWMRITNGANGSGGRNVEFTVDANPGDRRSGTITVAGQVFTLNQDRP
jgi:all-beta uncharacterized protein